MIMFPVLFQPQITANSVIRSLLCQPSSGPLTVFRPGAVFSQCLDLWALLRHQQLTEVYRSLQLPIKALVTEATVLCLINFLTLDFCHIPFFVITVTQWGPLKTGDYDRFQAPLQVIWHLNQVPLFWLDPLPQLYLGWKDLSSHWLLCSLPALCLTACLVVELATWCVSFCEYGLKIFMTVIGG